MTDYNDLIKRLRAGSCTPRIEMDAADAIETLQQGIAAYAMDNKSLTRGYYALLDDFMSRSQQIRILEENNALLQDRIEELKQKITESVRHGHWYRHTMKEHGDTCFYCSACERMAPSDCMLWDLTDYCPNCGATMDEVTR